MIGILGGTFDPVHFGHLRTALEVKARLDLSQLRLLPCHIPPHRDQPVASPAQRRAMLELALAGQDDLSLDCRELERPGPSYMVDTLADLRADIGEQSLCLILGDDAFAGLDRWHEWQRLIELAHIVVMSRPGHAQPGQGPVAELVRQRLQVSVTALRDSSAGYIHYCAVTQLEISATAIRALIGAGGSPRYLLPEQVLDYIRREGLYV
jgi:nicotinate-nucleotide adenylyltransferase